MQYIPKCDIFVKSVFSKKCGMAQANKSSTNTKECLRSKILHVSKAGGETVIVGNDDGGVQRLEI